MAFNPANGVAFVADGAVGGSDHLFTLNVSTGHLSDIGSTGIPGGIGGLAFVPVPEPTPWAIFGLGGLVLAWYAWQHKQKRSFAGYGDR
jgi:hypothetical protein